MTITALASLLPILVIAAAVLFIVLERLFPYDKGQPFFREGFFADLVFYALLQSYVLSLIISAIVYWIDAQTGLSRLRLLEGVPLWAQTLIFLITHDFYIYWFHRWQHHNKVLWRLHEAHHSVRQVDWIAGMRSHSLEILINQTIEFAPIVLLGAPPEMILIKGAIDGIWGMWIHSNIDVKSGVLQLIINGPEMHRWHHSCDIKEGGINFSTKLAIWDWLFGTAYLPKEKPSGYGITDTHYPLSITDGPLYIRFWEDTKSYIRQHLYAFRPLSESAA
ncbi:MAG: sterol desaturase family protein [Chloroherpetonaceae bacterium]|nr:sterol desaturase family protein [Chloroherpetonaceae bacterium]MCS7210127.1 sterol desaturase family protein [Chloroherpetonaceae bacterium]MDW8019881.1 sterol desaturase family protein [Chloroherpetonaceae bacterium]MDW8467069.1 sterol desaturase family protein [Chloroherpetonaceae bacterium]